MSFAKELKATAILYRINDLNSEEREQYERMKGYCRERALKGNVNTRIPWLHVKVITTLKLEGLTVEPRTEYTGEGEEEDFLLVWWNRA